MGRAKGGTTGASGYSRGYASGRSSSYSNTPTSGNCKARLEGSTAFAVTIDFVLFPRSGKTSEDGFTIAKAVHEGTGEKITIKGKFGPVTEGELIQIARGAWRDDTYGEHFIVWARSHKDPVTRGALISYLENLPGVGPTLATAIVDTYGNDCLAKIDANPALLLQVSTKGGRHL